MYELWDYLQQLINPERLLREGGFYLVLFVVFAETGLFFGFFLPGDYLLFLAGMFVATGKLDASIYTLVGGLIAAAVLGNFVGYWFGKKTGPVLYVRKDSLFFKKRYIRAAEEYYEKQGAFALIMGRFIPIVRTFAPIVAGVIGVNTRKFAFYNISGAILWVSSLTLLGFFLGRRFEKQIDEYLLYIIVGFIVVTAIPLVWTFLKRKFVLNKSENKKLNENINDYE
ncbi:membrane-associated protein [Arcticibacter tournemirensis]|uniref:DedA family protein n=1 Tax=Arcticibacter tournemirensis TaxID=699437 RepID=A0A4Q0MFF9_9SPHI|nr:DedA family protein [Arcticibacter tournemirensis]KAA8481658.1 DedA family protein [Arcticibacter tournemirensis]RXF71636.1 DedA family protein [Arcticibacter tournemirensis]TQM48944.1 membrane-associated protein [Arcticibacter tournemirensis]